MHIAQCPNTHAHGTRPANSHTCTSTCPTNDHACTRQPLRCVIPPVEWSPAPGKGLQPGRVVMEEEVKSQGPGHHGVCHEVCASGEISELCLCLQDGGEPWPCLAKVRGSLCGTLALPVCTGLCLSGRRRFKCWLTEAEPEATWRERALSQPAEDKCHHPGHRVTAFWCPQEGQGRADGAVGAHGQVPEEDQLEVGANCKPSTNGALSSAMSPT